MALLWGSSCSPATFEKCHYVVVSGDFDAVRESFFLRRSTASVVCKLCIQSDQKQKLPQISTGARHPEAVYLVIHFISPLPKVTQCPSGPLGVFVVVRCEMKTVFHYESAKPSHRIAFPGCSQSTDIHNLSGGRGEASRREKKRSNETFSAHFLPAFCAVSSRETNTAPAIGSV